MADENLYNAAVSGPQIDEAVLRAVNGGDIDVAIAALTALLSKKAPADLSIDNDLWHPARENLGISSFIDIPAGGSTTITLPKNAVYLIAGSSNVHCTVALVPVANSAIRQVVEIIEGGNTIYTYSGRDLTIANSGTVYGITVSVSTMYSSISTYDYPFKGGTL